MNLTTGTKQLVADVDGLICTEKQLQREAQLAADLSIHLPMVYIPQAWLSAPFCHFNRLGDI